MNQPSPTAAAPLVDAAPLAALDREQRRIYRQLADTHDELARLIERHGQPDPFAWTVLEQAAGREPFAELTLHIVSQISTPAAVTIYASLRTLLVDRVDPAGIIAQLVEQLRSIGLSNARTRSLRDLAERIADGRLSFDTLAHYDDAHAQAMLMTVRGIGPWSAQILLLHHFRRPDIFPTADVSLLRSAQSAFALPARPTPDQLDTRAEPWRPFRSYAAALLLAPGQGSQPRLSLPQLNDSLRDPVQVQSLA